METTVKERSVSKPNLNSGVYATGLTGKRGNRFLLSGFLVLSDLGALMLAGGTAISIRILLGDLTNSTFFTPLEYFNAGEYLRLLPLMGLFILIYASRGLYPAVAQTRVNEIHLLTVSTSLVVALFAIIIFFVQQGLLYSRLVFLLFWALALFFVPIARVVVRRMLVKLSLWGVPVGIVGTGPKATWVDDFLRRHPNLGYRPVVRFNGADLDRTYEDPVIGMDVNLLAGASAAQFLTRLDTLVVVQEETPEPILLKLVSVVNRDLPRVIMMPDLPAVGSMWVQPVDLGGVLTLKISNNLANRWQQVQKRVVDLTLTAIGMVVVLPLLGVIAVAIRLDSRGPIFFTQHRVGRGGSLFPLLKFRTMYCNAEARLEHILQEHPQKKSEWDTYQKLSDDPRVTRVGKALRALSLDELPQLFNVLRGEMSLVGPRPFFQAQTELYGASYENYLQVRPGITGMWQVNGRNKSSFAERAEMDEYYVRNWSVWLDIYILARTPIAVFSRQGAY